MSIKETGTKFFKNEEEMDTFLEDLQPGSTVVIKEANVSLAKEMDYVEELVTGTSHMDVPVRHLRVRVLP